MSRRPTPSAVKKNNGSFDHNPSRENKREPEPPKGTPDPPEGVCDKALRDWHWAVDMLSKRKVLTQADELILENMARAVDEREAADAIWKAQGMVVWNNNGTGARNPAIICAEKARDQILRNLIELGLTPASRQKLVALEEEEGQMDAFAEILKVAS